MFAAIHPPSVRREVIEMQTVFVGERQATRAVVIRLVVLVAVAAATFVLIASAVRLRSDVDERVPAFTAGPSVCRLDGYRVPCS
jgi:hypothetical protein